MKKDNRQKTEGTELTIKKTTENLERRKFTSTWR